MANKLGTDTIYFPCTNKLVSVPNKVYLVGAGPGDPGLITVRGQEILRQAEVVIYDYLVDKRILEETKAGTELICCDKLSGNKYGDGCLVHQEKINALIVKKAKEGKKVVRLKNGDVSLFSRLSQELEALAKNKISFELVPGVTAASSASCFSGIPLTDRRFASSCIFVTGHEDPLKKESALDWQSIAKQGTIVLYMAVERLGKIAERLVKAGKNKNTPVAIVQDAGLLTQKILVGTLGNIFQKAKAQKIRPPAIIIIGEAVGMEKKFNWLKKTKRALFTGISPERFFTKEKFFHLPLIKIKPLESYKKFDGLLKHIRDYDWLVFSSRFGAQYFFQRLNKIGYDARVLKGMKIAAIGNSTKNRLLDFGVLADLVPKEESSKGLIKEFRKIGIKGKKIFLPRSNLADKGLAAALKAQGAKVASAIAYQNVAAVDLPDLDLKFFDEIYFSSPSTVRNFKQRYKVVPWGTKIRCIGTVTEREVKRCRLAALEG